MSNQKLNSKHVNWARGTCQGIPWKDIRHFDMFKVWIDTRRSRCKAGYSWGAEHVHSVNYHDVIKIFCCYTCTFCCRQFTYLSSGISYLFGTGRRTQNRVKYLKLKTPSTEICLDLFNFHNFSST